MELRAQIWEMAIEPCNVFVVVAPSFIDPQLYKDHPKFELWGPRMYTRNTPAPAVLHKIYEQAFSITPTVRLKEFQETPKFRAWRYQKKSKRDGVVAKLDVNAQAERERRYFWVNFDIDTINISDASFMAYKDFDGDKIQRLQIDIRTTRFEYRDAENWDHHYEGLDEIVGAENVWLIPHPRLDSGIFKRTITLAKMRLELHEFWRREEEDREMGEEGYPTGQPLIETSAPGGE
ncbi:hypothetical protein QBC32DRAFT_309517 [Pseudoneurospora amorphoporcata]|uniref:Uncharacterized protein n=1 Tax=Pseudoneurospora amorphoporcata TaxID=241081 RepID=A0AAN6P3R1_9PEZI|nr:hypothetical protein QBC32DRAFT_309517 [Pseudoneurospora amorphoporcata]